MQEELEQNRTMFSNETGRQQTELEKERGAELEEIRCSLQAL